jgi:hypothetical protein
MPVSGDPDDCALELQSYLRRGASLRTNSLTNQSSSCVTSDSHCALHAARLFDAEQIPWPGRPCTRSRLDGAGEDRRPTSMLIGIDESTVTR